MNYGPLVYLAIAAFSLTVLFQLVNLPVEFDASARARRELVNNGVISPDEEPEVGQVLNAAALTYVAGTVTAVFTLLYFLYRAGLIGGHRRSDDR
jgi:Zn-dependent membrane protease YugP